MASVPILCRFQYDCHVRLFDIDEADDMDAVAARCAKHIVGRQVAPQPGKILRVRRTTEEDSAAPFPRDMTVEDARITRFEQLDVYFDDADRSNQAA